MEQHLLRCLHVRANNKVGRIHITCYIITFSITNLKVTKMAAIVVSTKHIYFVLQYSCSMLQ
jgi:hypothetical protein